MRTLRLLTLLLASTGLTVVVGCGGDAETKSSSGKVASTSEKSRSGADSNANATVATSVEVVHSASGNMEVPPSSQGNGSLVTAQASNAAQSANAAQSVNTSQSVNTVQSVNAVLSTPAAAPAPVKIVHPLVGVWLGVGQLNVDAFNQKYSTLDPATQKMLLAQAKTVQSTRIGVEYMDDGTFKLEVFMENITGDQGRHQLFGNWNIDNVVGQGVAVTTREKREDGSVEVSTREYTFRDVSHFAMVLDSAGLAEFAPVIFFERQQGVPTDEQYDAWEKSVAAQAAIDSGVPATATAPATQGAATVIQ